MSWRGVKAAIRDLHDPPYLRTLTPELRGSRRRFAERRASDLAPIFKAIAPHEQAAGDASGPDE